MGTAPFIKTPYYAPGPYTTQARKLKVKKSDRRYAGHPHFNYHIDLPVTGEHNFFAMRAWCWTTWGPSKSWQDWDSTNRRFDFGDTCQNANWCWIDDSFSRHRLLFAGKEDAALFTLGTGL
jgi:hypothetical protein